MPTIVAVAQLIASSGIDNATTAVQLGGASVLSNVFSSGPIFQSEKMVQSSGILLREQVAQHAGVSINEKIFSENPEELSTAVDFILFDPDFSRSTNLFGVIGASGIESAPKFFDRSPFYFSPSEVDPNIMRDFSEALQLMVYAQVPLIGFDIFDKTSSSAHLISVKGDTFASSLLSNDDIVVNGSFEEGLDNWTATASGGGSVTVEAPAGGFDPYLNISPADGSLYARMTKPAADPGAYQLLRATFGTREPVASSLLQQLFFQAAIRTTNGINNFRAAVFLRFLLEGEQVFLFRTQFSQMASPSVASLPEELRFPRATANLTGTFTAAQFKSFSIQIYEAMERASFDFDQVEVSFVIGVAGGTNVFDVKLDQVQLTVDLPEEHLLKTETFAHILTIHPVASGVPFTIEESEDIIITDETPPLFSQENPLRNTTFNDTTNRQMSFHIQDEGSSVDQATIDVFVDDLLVVQNGVVVTGTLWPVITKSVLSNNDILYTLTRSQDFDYQSTVVVSGTFADDASPPNPTTEVYQFTYWGANDLGATISGGPDVDPPVIIPLYPTDGAVQVSPDAQISWRVTDNSAGVDPTELKFFINGSLVIANDVASEGSFSRSPNANRGFDYVYSPAQDLAFGTTVTGVIEAVDFVGNSDTLEYSFTVTPDDTLEITNFWLGENQSSPITSGTFGSVEVIDLTYGVASGTTTLLQNGSPPVGLMATYSGAGPDRIIFTWPIEPNVNFREDILIQVHAENKFPGPFPVIQEAEYLLRPGYQVDWYNKDIAGSGTNISESVFPYLTNVYANTEVKNFAKNFNTGSEYIRWLTESQAVANLGAVLISSLGADDLNASLNVLSPHFSYGKEMTLEVEVTDLNGNTLSFTHVFTIEEG